MYTIFIVEDDAAIAGAVARYLTGLGCRAVCAADFSRVGEEFARADAHLVLLDITLPFYDGYYWCEKLRARGNVPIIFLSSASDKMNVILAMNTGADDFIAKPFDLPVLWAKIRALLRRAYEFSAPEPALTARGARLNTDDATLSYGGARIDLTKNEYRILQTLMERRGAVVSRETLMERLWESDAFVDENTLTVNVTRLRKKLDAAGLRDFIVTKKGLGYRVPGENA